MIARAKYFVVMMAVASTAAITGAQDIAGRVRAIGDGTVRFSFPVKEGVCGDGRGSISHIDGSKERNWIMNNGTLRGRRFDVECEPGPGRVVLEVARGQVTDLRFYVGGRWRDAEGRTEDLGTVSGREASEYLQWLMERGPEEIVKNTFVPAIVADAPDPYDMMLRIAKDDRRSRSVRSSAIFWLGQGAGDVATRELSNIVAADTVDREVRKQAVFALSQQRGDVGVDALIRVVRTNRDPALRKDALFWLGQSGSPKAIALIEELILKR
jgi:hypothetical protein